MDTEKKDTIAKALMDAGITQVVTCTQAYTIAEKHQISLEEIGKYCNSHGIKIRACQLGCFK
jgi:hypothetical protein